MPRVIHILSQVCGSLYEAHSLGLVHRDIKPANIMLNRRGGEPDVVKVLDFGLVKALDEEKQAGLTQQNSLTGTPLYMSPEAIQLPNSVDARSDLYAVGAVGYFLLTGQPVFRRRQRHGPLPAAHLRRPDSSVAARRRRRFRPPSKTPSWPASKSREPNARKLPANLAILLSRCPEATAWSIEEADAWWGRHERGQGPLGPATGTPSTAANRYAATIDQG